LPLVLPLYDMDDLQALSETDVWAGFWQQINQASRRYKSDEVLALTVDRVSVEGNELYRLTWQRQQDGRTLRDEVTAADEPALMQAFATALAAQLAQQYASVMLAEHNQAELLLQVNQLDTLTDLVQVQKLLQQIVGISDVTITRYEQAAAQFRLRSAISADSLLNALRFNPRLRLQGETADPAIALDVSQQPVLASFSYNRF